MGGVFACKHARVCTWIFACMLVCGYMKCARVRACMLVCECVSKCERSESGHRSDHHHNLHHHSFNSNPGYPGGFLACYVLFYAQAHAMLTRTPCTHI